MSMTEQDLIDIEENWLQQCTAINNAGLAISCTCPQEDLRNVISSLVDEVRQLREVQVSASTLLDEVNKWREAKFAMPWAINPAADALGELLHGEAVRRDTV